jgi:hypothetical protein
MNSEFFSDFRALLSLLWQYQPVLIVLASGGVIIFILSVIDTHRHRKRLKDKHKRLH